MTKGKELAVKVAATGAILYGSSWLIRLLIYAKDNEHLISAIGAIFIVLITIVPIFIGGFGILAIWSDDD